ncbi:hypothetical protein T492DRAFT_912660 [Pavlovales sp. CCMP2436]|nr:hypothetical protein T492DRAFT_912660 [Pavlovales sp. CCMP2436]
MASASPQVLTFLAFTAEDVGEENRTFLFTDQHKVRRFRISYDLAHDAITIDEWVHELRAAEGKRIERARWRPFLRKAEQDGGGATGQHIRVPRPGDREEFALHRNVGEQKPRAYPGMALAWSGDAEARNGLLDPDWQGAGVDKVNIRIHWPPVRGAERRRFVQLRDFAVGSPVTLFGHTFYVWDAPADTREYFAAAGRPLQSAQPVPRDAWMARQEALLVDEQARRALFASEAARRLAQVQQGQFSGGRPRRFEPEVFEAKGQVLRYWLRPDEPGPPQPSARGRGSTPASVHRTRTLLLRCCLRGGSKGVGEGGGSSKAELEELEVAELLELADGRHMRPDAPVLFRAGREWCAQREVTAAGERPNVPAHAELRVGSWVWLDSQRYFVLAVDEATRTALADAAMPPNFALDYQLHARALAAADAGGDPLVAVGRRGFDAAVRPAPAVRPGLQPEANAPTLRFFAQLAEEAAAQGYHQVVPHGGPSRTFVLAVSFDLRLSLREVAAANSGRQGGLVVRAPPLTQPVGHAYALGDFKIGQLVQVGGFRLLLSDAEEATLAWQEGRPDVFPESDIRRVLGLRAPQLLEQLRTHRAGLAGAFGPDGRMKGALDIDSFLRLLRAASTPPFDPLAGLTLHEAFTLFRAFRELEPIRNLVKLGTLERALELSGRLWTGG